MAAFQEGAGKSASFFFFTENSQFVIKTLKDEELELLTRKGLLESYYKHIHKEDLVTPMIKGDKALPASTPASHDNAISRVFALVIWIGCMYVVYLWVNWVP